MNEAACVVGIDVAKRKFDIALLINNKIKTKVFDNTPAGHKAFAGWLDERGVIRDEAHLCMEATGPYSETLATNLVEDGWRVSVVNPARIKGFAQGELARNKTDRADAALLARFCAAMHPSLWTPPPGSTSGERASIIGARRSDSYRLARQADQGARTQHQ